jgi:hypothetical protein
MSLRCASFLAAALLAAGAAPAFAQAAAPASRATAFAKLPFWGGLWISSDQVTTIGGINTNFLEAREKGQTGRPTGIMPLAGFSAPWNEAGKARQAERIKAGQGRKALGWGFPLMMNSAAPIEFLITPEEVMIVNPYNDIRHVYTDGRKHPAPDDLWPTAWGDSIGHWEGNTLVIDTIAVKNPNKYFHGAPPLSDNAHYVERIRMSAPGKIESDIVIEDPETLSGPWKSHVAYIPAEGFDRMVQMEFDNERTGFDGEYNTIEPPKDEK